ncbi:MAG: carbohydrate ABC transporter permease [Spirochaetales bacterium]|nr:carbohydrate ABC transporter permease [Spirochaetales bacterium]
MKANRKWLKNIPVQIVLILLALIMIYPLIWMLFGSFKSKADFFQGSFNLIPSTFYWKNYADGWAGFGGIPFGQFIKNSAVLSILVTIGTVLSSAWVANGFARIEFKGRKIWFAILMVTLMLPVQLLMVQRYIIFFHLKWINTILPIVVPAFLAYQPFFVFLLVQFIKTVPRELDEAAYIDGCSKIGVFIKIILPLTRPALITCTIFAFYWSWDDFINPLLYLNKPLNYTVSLALRLFNDPAAGSNWGAMFAMALVSLLPVIIVFLMFQKYIVEGISTQGLKG